MNNVEQNKNNSLQSTLQSTFPSSIIDTNTCTDTIYLDSNFDLFSSPITSDSFSSTHINTVNDFDLFSSHTDSTAHTSSLSSSTTSSSSQSQSQSQSSSSTTTAVNNEAASVHQCTDKWLSVIQQMRSSSKCSLSASELDELQSTHSKFGINALIPF